MTRGGKRVGAGRPKGTGKFGESTVPVRVPASLASEVADWVARRGEEGNKIPLFGASVRAGVPTMVDDHVQDQVNLHEMLVGRGDSTFMVRVQGESMRDAGMQEGDLLIVDRSLPALNGKIVVAALDGDLTVKTLKRVGNTVELWPENPAFSVIRVQDEQSFEIMGVVTTVVRQF